MDNYRKTGLALGAMALAGCAPLAKYDMVLRDEEGVYHYCTPNSQSTVKDEVFLRHGYLRTDKAKDYYTKKITAKDVQLMKAQADNTLAQRKVDSLEEALSITGNKVFPLTSADYQAVGIVGIATAAALLVGAGVYRLIKHFRK